MSRVVMAAALVMVAGCGAHSHRDRNAPGRIDPLTPPRDLERMEVDPPADPGEEYLTFTVGTTSGYGVLVPTEGETVGVGVLGLEVSLHRGRSDRSHHDDDLALFPVRSLAVNAGATVEGIGDDVDSELGPVYLEAQMMDFLRGVAVGYGVDPDDGVHGPQLTAFYWMGYARAGYLFDRGFEVHAGLVFKLPAWSLVWSR